MRYRRAIASLLLTVPFALGGRVTSAKGFDDPITTAIQQAESTGTDTTRPANSDAADKPVATSKPGSEPAYVPKTDSEWRKILTRPQYMVTRQKATERAFSGRYVNNHQAGIYTCICCGAELFSSATKFESGTGWPSFYGPLKQGGVQQTPDYSEAEPRVEVTCQRCGAHLGHVFDDGPRPTGLRYCINSVSLNFKRSGNADAANAKSADSKTKAKPKTASKSKSAPSSESAETGKTVAPKE